MTAKERKYMIVMSVGFLGVILWHFICPKLCRALPEASHLTCVWTGIINHHLALLSQESDCCPPAFSEIFLLCFPSGLVLHHRGYSLVHPFHTGIQCS